MDEALAGIAARLREIIDAWGAEAVLPYSYAGTMGWLQQDGMSGRFFQQMGASRLARTICSEAGFEGYLYTIGSTIGVEPEDFTHARLILIWGSNTLTSNLHLWPFIQDARRQGGRVIVIDPARTRTARAADEWIPIRPGTDGALALAMMHEIIDAGLHDRDYVSAHTVGFEQLAERVQEWTPQRAAEITGVPAERIGRAGARIWGDAAGGDPSQLRDAAPLRRREWRCATSPVCRRWWGRGGSGAAASS